jgi:hypothetical protein
LAGAKFGSIDVGRPDQIIWAKKKFNDKAYFEKYELNSGATTATLKESTEGFWDRSFDWVYRI